MGWRAALLAILVGFVTLLSGSAAAAAPVKDLKDLPADLQKYVPNSPEFANAPWMTSPTCQDKGGDFSIWASNVINDTPSLLAHFQSSSFGPDANARDKAIIAGYQQIAAEIAPILPPGYCVEDMQRWTGADYNTKPFGFPWGLVGKDGHQTSYYCTDRDPNTASHLENNRYFGAERAMCDGFYITCDKAQENEKAQCEAWNTFSDEYVRRVDTMRGKAINDMPQSGTAATDTKVKTPGDILDDVGEAIGPVGWFAELTKTIATGVAKLMAEAMTFWTRTDRTTMLQSPAITEIQNMLRYVGIALLAASVIWQGLLMIIKRKADPLVSTGMGLLSFVGWSTMGGTIAVLLNEAGNALANQVLDESINNFANTIGDSLVGQAVVATGVIFFLSIILFFLACIQWALGFFRMGALVILLALVPTAAAGQANDATKPWLKKVLGWCLTLILYQPIAAIIFAVGLQLIGSGGQSISTVLVGMAVLALAVLSMPTMLRFFDWGGQKMVNSGGGGGAMAVGAAASVFSNFAHYMNHSGPAGGRDGGRTSNDGRTTGAAPVSSAHAGDGPGDGSAGGPTGSGGDGGSPAAAGGGGGPQGGPGGQRHGVSPASSGQPGGGIPVGAEVGGGSTGATSAGTGGAGTGGGSAAAGGGGAAAAHPAAAAAAGGVEGVRQGFNAAAGAMTDGAGESGGPR